MIHFERKTLLRDTLLLGLSLTLLIAATFVASFGGGVWFSRAANTALAGSGGLKHCNAGLCVH